MDSILPPSTKTFIRHYIEMVLVMFVGMGILWAPLEAALHPAGSAYLFVMATSMSVPMVAWMRWRGHGWQPSLEMAVSMYLPTFAAMLMLATSLVTDMGVLLVVEHNAMLVAMLIAMLLRRDEYSSHAHHQHAVAEAA